MEKQRPGVVHARATKGKPSRGGRPPPNVTIRREAAGIRASQSWQEHRHVDPWARAKGPDTDPPRHTRLILRKAKATKWRAASFPEQPGIHLPKNVSQVASLLRKNYRGDAKCKTWRRHSGRKGSRRPRGPRVWRRPGSCDVQCRILDKVGVNKVTRSGGRLITPD